MVHLLLGVRDWDGLFTVRYKEMEWNTYFSVLEFGMYHSLLGTRKWEGKFTVSYKKLVWKNYG